MLPGGGGPIAPDPTSKWASEATRYGNFAMEALINEILKNGGRKENLEIKIFGGGKIMENMTNIGDMNIRFVREFIHAEGQKLRSLHNNTIVERERKYSESLQAQPIEGDIDLF